MTQMAVERPARHGYRRSMTLIETAVHIAPILRSQGRLIHLPADQFIVFVGDTHGDIDATERVFARYLKRNHTIVFLGDTVDRGPDSTGNLALILETKRAHPESVHLLMGNHEAWAVSPFQPADFWESLGEDEEHSLTEVLSCLPYAAHHAAGVLGLHGALPNLHTLNDIQSVPLGSDAWRAMTWGDWIESDEDGPVQYGRPTFGRTAFDARTTSLGISILVRSHQPLAPQMMYDNRCLTLFTSDAYGPGPRRVAVLDPSETVQSALDLEIHDIDVAAS